MKALVVLEDGFSLEGECFAGRGTVFGEVVFNTGMSGYQEMITDPSYKGQILTLTYPLIGNYGVNDEDAESASPQVEALLVKECCRRPYNRRAKESLDRYLNRHGIIGVEGIDTRSLTLHLRSAGTLKGAISTEAESREELLARLKAHTFNEAGLVEQVSCRFPYRWEEGQQEQGGGTGTGPHVVVYDFGVRYGILRSLARRGCRVTVFPPPPGPGKYWPWSPAGLSSPTARETRPIWPACCPRSALSWTGCPCSGSAWATSCSAWPSAARPISCPSAIAVPTSRCANWPGGGS